MLMFAVRSIFAKPERVVAALREAAAKGKIDKSLGESSPSRSAFSFTTAAPPTSPRRPTALPATSPASTWCCSAPATPAHLRTNVASLLKPPLPEADREKLAALFGN